jgi:hypothetical protein
MYVMHHDFLFASPPRAAVRRRTSPGGMYSKAESLPVVLSSKHVFVFPFFGAYIT